MRVLLVAGSPEPSSSKLVSQLAASVDSVIAVDRGAEVCRAANIVPNAFCGDADTVSLDTLAWIKSTTNNVELYEPAKDDTDLSLAFDCARALAKAQNQELELAVFLVMIYEGVMPTWSFLLLPVCLFLLCMFCIGVSLLLSALAVFFRDVIHLWSVLLMAWNYATPIFWPVSMIDAVPYGFMRVIMLGNPMYNYVTFMRMIILNGQVPEPATWAMCIFWAIFAIILGTLVFRKTEHKFILYV